MDNVLTEFISKTSADPGLARDILESNKWKLNDALNDFQILKPNPMETNLDSTADVEKKRKCDNHLIKSNSHPSLNTVPTTTNSLSNEDNRTVIDEPKVTIKLNNKSIHKSIDKLTDAKSDKSNDQPPVVQKKLLFRGISRATDNIHLVQKVRGEFAQDFQTIKDNDSYNGKLNLDLPDHTFTLPDISIHPDDFRQFLEKDLIEKSTLISLKNANRLNWWSDELNIAQKLWPLATTGDGNCLLHACSLGTWGFHDRLLTLRKVIYIRHF